MGKIEQIAKRHGVTCTLATEKKKAMSVTDAAEALTKEKNFNKATWLKARNTLYGLNANAGRTLTNVQIVASLLVGASGEAQ